MVLKSVTWGKHFAFLKFLFVETAVALFGLFLAVGSFYAFVLK